MANPTERTDETQAAREPGRHSGLPRQAPRRAAAPRADVAHGRRRHRHAWRSSCSPVTRSRCRVRRPARGRRSRRSCLRITCAATSSSSQRIWRVNNRRSSNPLPAPARRDRPARRPLKVATRRPMTGAAANIKASSPTTSRSAGVLLIDSRTPNAGHRRCRRHRSRQLDRRISGRSSNSWLRASTAIRRRRDRALRRSTPPATTPAAPAAAVRAPPAHVDAARTAGAPKETAPIVAGGADPTPARGHRHRNGPAQSVGGHVRGTRRVPGDDARLFARSAVGRDSSGRTRAGLRIAGADAGAILAWP